MARHTATAGFTLLELIVVMVIMSAVLAIAAPSLRMFSGSRPVADAAALIVALTQYARSQAIAEGRVYRLNFDMAKGEYWLTAQDRGAFAPLGSEFGRVFSVPQGATVNWIDPPPPLVVVNTPGLQLPGQLSAPDGVASTPMAGATPGLQLPGLARAPVASLSPTRDYITFYPDGRTEAARLRLTDRRQNALEVVCPAPAERFRVVTPNGGGSG